MSSTVSLALATVAFVGLHFLMSHPLRPAMIARLGERAFAGVYSLIVAIPFVWMIFAWRSGDDYGPQYIAPIWWWPVASAIMLFALILLVGSFMKNPALPHPGASSATRAVRPATGVFAITRHPMNWAFTLWAIVHITLWGSPRNLIVAGGILILALFGSIGQDRKKAGLYGDAWRGWEARTSFVPFGALFTGKVPWRAANPSWVPLLVGFLLWLVITWYHAPVVSPIGSLGRGFG
ncbi:MAG TPA: NnrU family protein [Allosphingosinicella sp.]|uniref:NnrU family protein n=1 Tax=Allosphingosinicella sp. TaxID=2823234 RepID=UPI002ED813E0